LGDDSITASNGANTLLGGNGNDSITGGNQQDRIFGGNGNDSILGGAGNDTLDGGDGTDWAIYASATGVVTVNLAAGTSSGAAGNDSLTGIENVLGGNGDDSILGDGLANILSGGDGSDTLAGSNGDDTLYGGAGNDIGDFRGFGIIVTVDLVQGLVFDEGGTTRFFDIEGILTSTGEATLARGGGGDTFTGGTANDLVIGGTGNDEMVGGLGDDTFDGGSGNDQILGGDGDDELSGGLGNDSFDGGTGDDLIFGGDGNDSLGGGSGNDCLQGGDFNDTFQGGPGNDTFIGGTGRDLVDYSYVTGHGVTVSLQADSAYGGSEDVLSSIEDVTGSNQDDVLIGNGNDNLINGLAGNDTLSGGAGTDTLDGGAGTRDFASYATASDTVRASLSDDETVGGGAEGADGSDRLFGIEGLIGSNFNDELTGNSGANTLYGGAGDDTLSGGNDNDWLDFGTGNELFVRDITRDSGNDTLIGGDGNDTLDLQTNWSFLSEEGGFSLYQDNDDTIYVQDWEQVVCFAEGTRIVTPNGEVLVENLRAGDMVLAMRDGQAGFEALRWVGFMDIAVPRNAVMAAKTAPILIKAGAIGPGMPARDLRVSPDHATEVDGHLIPAKHLVNGESIVQEFWCKRVRYFHLELEAHGLLLSEGTWSESYLDDGNRHAFNSAALTGLFLDFEAGRSKGQYDHQACLPVLRQGLKLDEIHGRIALRAEELACGHKLKRNR
jgi:Ca2+-binding RTX toxin-like protein